eukprot:7138249-Ditylum_brightwellii.AAC.2
MLFQGKLRQAVRWLTGQEKGGLIFPDDRCTKSGELMSEVLQTKHPETVEPQVEAFKMFPNVPAFMDVNVTASVVEK